MNKTGGFFLENSPQNESEARDETRINEIVEKIMDDAMDRRRILTLEELCSMKNVSPHFEEFFPDVHAWFYSIDGSLYGENLTGAMLAGHCMLVFAVGRESAEEIARSGLNDTISLTNEYATSDDAYLAEQEANAANSGIQVYAGRNVN